MSPLHVTHVQPKAGDGTWCGLQRPNGPRIEGVENFIYYTEDGPGPVCAACVTAILKSITRLIQAKGVPE
jgi:hypothetical protein